MAGVDAKVLEFSLPVAPQRTAAREVMKLKYTGVRFDSNHGKRFGGLVTGRHRSAIASSS
jgi:hypothetical protein